MHIPPNTLSAHRGHVYQQNCQHLFMQTSGILLFTVRSHLKYTYNLYYLIKSTLTTCTTHYFSFPTLQKVFFTYLHFLIPKKIVLFLNLATFSEIQLCSKFFTLVLILTVDQSVLKITMTTPEDALTSSRVVTSLSCRLYQVSSPW